MRILFFYYNTVNILDYLTYEDNPIPSFLRLLRRQQIKLSLGNPEYRFCFTFSSKDDIKFYCNTIYVFLQYCPSKMLEDCQNQIKSFISSELKTIPLNPKEDYYIHKVPHLKDFELYKYLSNYDFIRINYYLEDLYLLLYSDKIIEFKNDDVTDLLKLKIINNEC